MGQPGIRTIDDGSLALERTLRDAVASAATERPPRLQRALEHAVFPGGSRLRPRLCLAVARACSANAPSPLAFAAAAAVELMHCASLVHDDLPCFDGSDLRRGRPSVHRAFGDAMAVLVGDGLIVLAFETLTRGLATSGTVEPSALLALAEASGPCRGLVAGQAWELEAGDVDVLRYHRAKTASLFELATFLGALTAGGDAAAFRRFGREVGMAYQAVDDLADRIGSAALLGKPTGRDEALGRPNLAGDLSVARSAASRAVAAVPPCRGEGTLKIMVETVVNALGVDVPARSHGPDHASG